MQATLQLNLSDALTPDELRELTTQAAARKVSIERLLFEAARKLAGKTKRKNSLNH